MTVNDPANKAWIDVDANHDFPIQNIPFGIASWPGQSPVAVTRIGDKVINLEVLAELDYIPVNAELMAGPTLNGFFAGGRALITQVRNALGELFHVDNPKLRDHAEHREHVLVDADKVEMHLPVHVPNYTDFYSSEEHATNIGTMFRGKDNALMPNWKYIPVGYHGRASSIIVSGKNIRRPNGQQKPNEDEPPVFGPCKLLDFELEMAFITCGNTELGQPIPVDKAEDHMAGLVLFNDWSARDIQKWEYVPLGPFLGKNFGSSVSPWVVTMDALEPFRVQGPKQDPPALPYLKHDKPASFDIALEAFIETDTIPEPHKLTTSNFKYMYWSMAQQLAHHTVNGCNIEVGDMYGSGTISGPTPDSYGSMLELTWRGTKPIQLADGTERKFFQDGDTVVMKGHCEKEGVRIGFGEVRSTILPALKL